MATATKPAPAAAAEETQAPAASPIQLKVTPAVTHANFHGTDIEFKKDEVVLHTNEKVALEPADDETKATKGTFDIRYTQDFNYVATRGAKVSQNKTGLTVSFDPDIKVSVQAVPAAPAP